MEVIYEVKMIEHTICCDTCGDGDMKSEGGMSDGYIMHKCDNCGDIAFFRRSYPYIERKYVEVKADDE